jgi:hypothetical protein
VFQVRIDHFEYNFQSEYKDLYGWLTDALGDIVLYVCWMYCFQHYENCHEQLFFNLRQICSFHGESHHISKA